jgi:integrase/recombinase XerD
VSALRAGLADYLALRRGLGYRLVRAEKQLAQFVAFLEEGGHEHATIDAALAWARAPAGGSPGWWGQRLSVARALAAYLHTLDPAHEVPPADLLPARSGRATPYLYTDAEIAALIEAARGLRAPLRALTLPTLIALLATTGLRIGEALALDRADLDLAEGILTVRAGKLAKARELMLHPTSVAALTEYLAQRERLCPAPADPALFLSLAGTRLLYCNFHLAFCGLVAAAGIRPRSGACRPRPHDLRHTFAVRTLAGWYAAGAEVGALLPRLSTYLGHVSPSATYWYLEAAPELLGAAAERLERHLEGRP